MNAEQCQHQDSIQVLVRIKPGTDDESVIYTNNQIKLDRHTYAFDRIFPPTSQQEDIFLAVGKKLIAHTLEGYNSCIFVYGQTGSGKTHTMMGNGSGLMQRSFCELFSRIDRMSCTQCIVTCSYYQLYNQQIIDLLDTRKQRKNLNIRQDVRRGVFVQNLTEQLALNSQKLLQCLTIGMKNRHIGQTMMNRQSSRSHSIFTISLAIKLETEGRKYLKTPKLHFVDLAGSERQKATLATGDRLKEAGNINKSLTTLGMVINALASDKPKVHIPYRDSKLTCLLRDSLGGNSKTFIVATIANSILCFQETLSTLNFANRAKMVKVKALVNQQSLSTNIQQYKQEIRKLKLQIAQLKSQKRVNSDPSTASESVSSKRGGFDHKFQEITDKIQDLKSNMMKSSMESFMEMLSKNKQAKEVMVDQSRQQKQMEEGNQLIQYMVSNHQLLKKINSTMQEYGQLKQQIKSLQFSRRVNQVQMKTPSKFQRDQYQQLLAKRQQQIKQLEEKIVSLKESGLKKQLQNRELRKKILSFESIKTEESDQVDRLISDHQQLQKKCSQLQLFYEIATQEKTRFMKLTQELQNRLRESKQLYLYSQQKNENEKTIRHRLQANIKDANRKIQTIQQDKQRQIQEYINKIQIFQEKIQEKQRRQQQLKSQIEILNETLQFNQKKIKEYSQKIHQTNKTMQEINTQKMLLGQSIMDMELKHQAQQMEYSKTISQLTYFCSQLTNNKSLLQNDQIKIKQEKQILTQQYQLLKEQSQQNNYVINQQEEQLKNHKQLFAEINAACDLLKTQHKKNSQQYQLRIYTLQRNTSDLNNQLEIMESLKKQIEERYQWQKQTWTNQNNRMISENQILDKQKLQALQKNSVYEKKLSELQSNIETNKNVVEQFQQIKKTYKQVIKQNYKLKGEYHINSQSQNCKSQQLQSKVTFYQQKFRLMSIQYNKVQDTTKKLKQKELNLIKKLQFYQENQKLKKISTSSEAQEIKEERYKALQLENDQLKQSLVKITNMYQTRLQNDKKEDYTKRISIENQKYQLTQRQEKIRKKLENAIKNWNHAKQNNCSGMSLDEMFVCWEKIQVQSRKKFQGIAKAIRRQQKLKSQNNFIIKQNFYLKERIDSLQKQVNLNSMGNPRKMLKLSEQRVEDNQ